MKLLGQMKPKRWQLLGRIKPKGLKLQFLKRPFLRARASEAAPKTISENNMLNDIPATHAIGESHQSCSQLQR